MAGVRKATVQTFGSVLGNLITEYTEDVTRNIAEEIKAIGKDAQADVKERASRYGWGADYVGGWTVKNSKAKNLATATVWNRPRYMLVHLLEDGHNISNQYGATGKRARAFPHVKEVQAKYDLEALRRIRGVINK